MRFKNSSWKSSLEVVTVIQVWDNDDINYLGFIGDEFEMSLDICIGVSLGIGVGIGTDINIDVI